MAKLNSLAIEKNEIIEIQKFTNRFTFSDSIWSKVVFGIENNDTSMPNSFNIFA